jgi:outer membrane protein OmpA-like peptidoglycan-associated protein
MYRLQIILAAWLIVLATPGFGQAAGNKATGNKAASRPPVVDDVENLGDSINSPYDELGPIISPDGRTLYFVVDNHPQNTFGKEGSQDIWYSQLGPDGSWTKARRMPEPFNLGQYNSVESVTPDGNTVIIRGAYRNGRLRGEGFSTAHRMKGGWSIPEQLIIDGFNDLNKGIFTNAFLSNDGRNLLLAFSETKKSEANDLYISSLNPDGSWSRPKRLGNLNTPGSEDTPFLASDGVTLYFTSDRPGGLGSHDMYMSRRLDDTWEKWSEPKNLGAPINTNDWDSYYSIDATGEFAYLVSGKFTDRGADIVRVKLKEEFRPEPVVLIVGKVFNAKTKEPLAAAINYENLSSGSQLGTARSDPERGDYKIVLPLGTNYGFRAAAPGFIAVSDNIDLSRLRADAIADNMVTDTTLRDVLVVAGTQNGSGNPPADSDIVTGNGSGGSSYTPGVVGDTTLRLGQIINRDLYLVPVEVGQVVRLNNVFFDFDKTELRPESFPELDRVVTFMNENPNVEIQIEGHTDAKGTDEYNLNLSGGRITSVEAYMESKGIAPSRIVTKSYGESVPIADNESEEGRQQNRRVEFKILKN